ncbi:MAG: tyrosine-protein phosphatase [Acidimicrobiia bacterium]
MTDGGIQSTLTDLRVERDGDALVASWTVNGVPVAVDVAWGTTPRLIDHSHALTVAAGTTAARLAPVPPGRQYVSVGLHGEGGALVAAERVLPFENVVNFRDLGGYPVAGGGHTRWGMLFRSASLSALTDADRDALETLGLRLIIDLRRELEVEKQPTQLANGSTIRIVNLPFLSEGRGTHVVRAEGSEKITDGTVFLAQIYTGIIDNASAEIAAAFDLFAQPDNLPALFHCMVGKDRTGMLAGLLLSYLGVPDEHVLDDYELTTHHMELSRYIDSSQPPQPGAMAPETLAGLFASPRHLMSDLLAYVRAQHGSVENYLMRTCGMRAETLAALRSALVA